MAETDYSAINFDITAQNTSALNSLDRVIEKLKSLRDVVSDGGVAKGIRDISSALGSLKGFSNAEAKNITAMTDALSRLNGISISGNIATGIASIANAARSVSDADVEHIRKLAEAMRGFSALQGVSGAAIHAATGAKKEASDADGLANSLTQVQSAAEGATNALYEMSKARQEAFGYADVNSFETVHPGVSKAQSTPLLGVRPEVFDAQGRDVVPPGGERPFSGTMYGQPEPKLLPGPKPEDNETTAKTIDLSKTLSDVLSSTLSAAARTAAGAFKDLTSAMAGFMASAGKRTWDFLTGGITGFAGAIGNLAHQIKRVAVYRLLRTLVKDVGAALSEGIQNLYQWSLAVDQSFSNAMNTISTAGAYIKNSVAAMVAPLLESLAPALDWLASKIVAVLNLLNQLFSLLTGKGFWTKASRPRISQRPRPVA